MRISSGYPQKNNQKSEASRAQRQKHASGRNLTAPNTHKSTTGKIDLQCKPANHHIYSSMGYNEKNNIQNSVLDKMSGFDLLNLIEEMQPMYNGRIMRPLLVLGSSPHSGPHFLAWAMILYAAAMGMEKPAVKTLEGAVEGILHADASAVALAMNMRLGMGTSLDLGLLKKPGQAGTTFWLLAEDGVPSREVLELRFEACGGEVLRAFT